MTGIRIEDHATPSIKSMVDGMSSALRRGSFRAAQAAAGEIRKEVMSTSKGRTGHLARSFKARWISQAAHHVSAAALSDLSYAGIQNDGGDIYPRTGKALAVPIFGGKNLPVGKWPRHFPKKGRNALHFIKRKGKPPLLAQVTRTRMKPLFILVRKVTIKPKRYIEAARAKVQPEINRILGREVETTIVRAVK